MLSWLCIWLDTGHGPDLCRAVAGGEAWSSRLVEAPAPAGGSVKETEIGGAQGNGPAGSAEKGGYAGAWRTLSSRSALQHDLMERLPVSGHAKLRQDLLHVGYEAVLGT